MISLSDSWLIPEYRRQYEAWQKYLQEPAALQASPSGFLAADLVIFQARLAAVTLESLEHPRMKEPKPESKADLLEFAKREEERILKELGF